MDPVEEDFQIPDTILAGIVGAADEIFPSEKWALQDRRAVQDLLPRFISGVTSMPAKILASNAGGNSGPAKAAREAALRILAYMPADLRLAAVTDIAMRDPTAIDNLISGKIRASCEIYRYNLLSTLGVFARCALVEEVVSGDRLTRVGETYNRVKKKISSQEGKSQ